MIEPVQCPSQHVEASSLVIRMAGCTLERVIQGGVQTGFRIELISDISMAVHTQIGL
ncbi:MAG TPA: hypothetical protein VE136_16705 [Anaerolineales bacterium]|nr:hypothetical protein [Anaerolineales bacterium]